MSLRFKALAAVLLLVTAVTGSLLAFVNATLTPEYEAEIEKDLAVDGQQLQNVIRSTKEIKLSALQAVLAQETLAPLISTEGGLKENLLPKGSDWAQQAGANGAAIALEPLFAEQNSARPIFKGKDAWIVSAWHGGEVTNVAKDVIASQELYDLLVRSIRDIRPHSAVIPLGDGLVLAVATPFFRTPREFVRFLEFARSHANIPYGSPAWETERDKTVGDLDLWGAAAVFIDLSSNWTRENRPRNAIESGSARDNPVHQVLFFGDRPAASSFDHPEAAAGIVNAARESGVAKFKLPLRLGPAPEETYIGVARSFDDAPFDKSRPGFAAIKSYDKEMVPLRRLSVNIGIVGLIIGVLGSLAAYGLAYTVIRKLRLLQFAAERVKQGDFSVAVNIPGKDEVGALGRTFNNMIKGLQALGTYTDSILARSVLDNPELLSGKATRREGTILFTDIKDFTSITERQDAVALTSQLNEYFSAIGEHVKREKGYLDKFIGDAVMAYWGEPFTSSADYAIRCCRTALLCRGAIADLRRVWKTSAQPLFFQRMGIATGDVVVGNIGSQAKKNFTVIGDSVNLASRLEGANKIYGTEILVDERTVALAGSEILVRELDQIAIRGKEHPVRIFELMGLSADTSTKALRVIEAYGKALALFRSGDFRAALGATDSLLKFEPEDGPAKWLRQRCEEGLSGGNPGVISVTRRF